jgi:hypothetical protein
MVTVASTGRPTVTAAAGVNVTPSPSRVSASWPALSRDTWSTVSVATAWASAPE